jgi:FMN phosphatase YigB (HAD superfamily)
VARVRSPIIAVLIVVSLAVGGAGIINGSIPIHDRASISVDEVKIYKPRAAAYQLAVRKLGVNRKDVAFVSSNFWDATGAKVFGFTAYWVNRSGATADELGITPDAALSALTELAEFVKA